MQNTTNYNFKKPEPTDFYNIEDQNANWDEADRIINEHTSADNPHKITKTTIGLENVENKSSETIRGEMTAENVNDALGYTAADKKELDDGLHHNVSNVVSDEEMVDLPEAKVGGLKINEIRGKTVQKKLSGKNLLPNTATTKTIDGVTFTVNEDKSVTCNGTATVRTNIKLCTDIDIQDGEYIISGVKNGSWTTFYMSCTDNATIYNDKKINYGGNKKISCWIYIAQGYKCDNLTFYPMLRKADNQDNSYEPYCGGIPTPNPEYEAKIENPSFSEINSYSLNLFDENQYLKASGWKKEDSLFIGTTETLYQIYKTGFKMPPFIPNTQYFIDIKGKTNDQPIYFQIKYTDETLDEITISEKILTTKKLVTQKNKTVKYIRPFYRQNSIITLEKTLVSVSNSKATLPLTTLADGDKIIEKDGVWGSYKTKGSVTFDGSSDENWVSESTSATYFLLNRNLNSKSQSKCVCNRALYEFNRDEKGYCYINFNKFIIGADRTEFPTVQSFRTWLSTHNLIVEYELAEPIFEPFPEETQRALRSLKTFDGTTHVSTDSVIPPTMDLSYGNLNTSAEIIDLDNRMTNEESTLKELGTEVEEVKKNSKNNEMFIAPEVKDSGYYMIDLKKVVPGNLTFKIRIIDTSETKEIQVSGNGERTNGWSSYYAEMLYATYAGITPLLFGYRGTGASPSHLCLAIEAKNVKNIEVFDASVEGEADQEFYKNLFSIYYAPNFTATLQETENLRSPRGKDMVNKEIHMNQGTVYELGGIKIYKKAIVVTHIAETSEVYIHTIVGQYGYLDGLEGGFKCNVNIARMGNSEKFDIVVKDSGYGPRITLENASNGNTESTVFYM